jgi:hypothetical protein
MLNNVLRGHGAFWEGLIYRWSTGILAPSEHPSFENVLKFFLRGCAPFEGIIPAAPAVSHARSVGNLVSIAENPSSREILLSRTSAVPLAADSENVVWSHPMEFVDSEIL